MIQFMYSFCMALLHSFWQAALLLLLYFILNNITNRNNAPLAKRNFLYAALAVQLVLFVITFFLYFFESTGYGNLPVLVQSITNFVDSSSLQEITPWLFGLYVFTIGYKLVKAMYTWYHFKQLYRSGLQKPSVDLKLFTTSKAHQFGIKRKVTFWLSHSIHTPVTFGFFRPIILLPVALVNNISTQQAETLILHELAHIRTNDYLLNWFLLSAETIFFFNPFIRSLCKQIRLEREKNCDISVIAFEYSPALYAETLLKAERMKQTVPAFQLAAVNRKKYLLQRIRYFTSEKIIHQTLRFNIVAPLIGLILLVMLSTAVLFQSGNTSMPIHAAMGMPFVPFSKHIITDADFGSHNITWFKTLQNPVSASELQKPAIKNMMGKQVETASKRQPEKAEVSAMPVDDLYAIPVAIWDNDAARQIIVKEEGSGTASVKLYYLSFENGKWILKPEWVLTANEIITDSLAVSIDSLKKNIKRIYPAQQ